MNKADEAFDSWVSTRFEAGITPITDLERAVWHAAWLARGQADVEAVGGERLEDHNVGTCRLIECPDCGYEAGLNDATRAIEALDEGSGDKTATTAEVKDEQ